MHGNELVGVEIVRWLQGLLNNAPFSTFDSMNGELIVGLGNPKLLKQGLGLAKKT